MKRSVVLPGLPSFSHGADYNPEQWQAYPEVRLEDLRLMNLARLNTVSLGIFAWSSLEPEEGRYTFEWLDAVMDQLHAHGVHVILATPSGARPGWMSHRYPEVLRVGPNRVRNLHGGRHNHCYTSPQYREQVGRINAELAERYGAHPALIGWHVSNEYGGECHCELCQSAFRTWLKERYGSLETLNQAWWTSFWSHTYTDWDHIESPAPHGETHLHGLNLAWKRFVTDQTINFYLHEIEPLRAKTPAIPITTNFMGTYPGLDYWKFAEVVDVVSWDSYPEWHQPGFDVRLASDVAFVHDLNRSLKQGKPFLLMESTPSVTNWQAVAKVKRPGMHLLSSLQAVAHGADSVSYFQWRKSRGASEKFHGAVVDHVGHEHTRVFQDVQAVGTVLAELQPVLGTTVPAEVGLIFDWENRWALEDAQGPRQRGRDYVQTCQAHYRAFWKQGIPVDLVSERGDWSRYRLMVAPMLYLVRPKMAERIQQFVADGGTLVATYWSGIVDEDDRCFLGGMPGPLAEVLGIWSEELDSLYDQEANSLTVSADNGLGLKSSSYRVHTFCDLIHAQSAKVLASYDDDFYRGRSALTENRWGKGRAYYLAARTDDDFLDAFYTALAKTDGVSPVLASPLKPGISVSLRSDGERDYIFLMNWNPEAQSLRLDKDQNLTSLAGAELTRGGVTLPPYGVSVATRSTSR